MSRTASCLSSVFVAFLIACGESAGPSHAQQDAVSVQEDALELSLSVEPKSITAGDTARIAFALRNTSDRALHLEAGGCPLVHYVANAAGEQVVPGGGGWVCILILQKIDLAPGGSLERVEEWTGESCPQVNPERGCTALPAGDYGVYATFNASEDGQPVSLRTPKVNVRLGS